MAELDDLQLLRNWQAGDREAGTELVRRHHAALIRFLIDKVGHDGGKEVAQNVFLTLCERRGDFREESSFRCYLFGIARWKIVEHIRKANKQRARFNPAEDSTLTVIAPSMTQVVTGRLQANVVVQSLRALPLDEQILLELHYHEKLTYPELAIIFEAPEGTLKSRVRRARERLEAQVAAVRGTTGEQLANLTETSLHTYWTHVHETWRATTPEPTGPADSGT